MAKKDEILQLTVGQGSGAENLTLAVVKVLKDFEFSDALKEYLSRPRLFPSHVYDESGFLDWLKANQYVYDLKVFEIVLGDGIGRPPEMIREDASTWVAM